MSDTIRNKAIDGWRFLFALLIIWHHLPWVSGHLHELGYCAVSFFFIVSGYLSYSSDTSNLKNYYVRKFFRIFPIYWIALLLSLIETIPIRSFWNEHCIWDILQHLFLLQAYFKNPTCYLNPPMWFLCVLVLFYALLPLCQHLLKRYPISFTIGVGVYALAMVLITWLCFDGEYWMRVNMPFVRIVECLLGMLLAYYLKDKSVSKLHCFVAVGILALFFVFATQFPNQYLRPYLSIPIMAYLCIAYMKRQGDSLLNMFNKWGGVSMEIYVFHSLVIIGLVRFVDITGIALPDWTKVLGCYLITIPLAWCYHLYINPHILKLEKKILLFLK